MRAQLLKTECVFSEELWLHKDLPDYLLTFLQFKSSLLAFLARKPAVLFSHALINC
jgi:hypothetical protein